MKRPTKTRLSYTDSVRAQTGISSCNQRTILLFTRQRSHNNIFTLLNTIYIFFFYIYNLKSQFPLLPFPESCLPKILPAKTNSKLSTKLLRANAPLSSLWEEIEVSSKASGDTVLKKKYFLLKTFSKLLLRFTWLFANRTKNYMFHSV